MKKFKDIAHFYLGCEVGSIVTGKMGNLFSVYLNDNCVINTSSHPSGFFSNLSHLKPFLRPLSDMTNDEAEEFILMCMNSRHHMEEEDFAIADEIDFKIIKNDGGNLLDDDVLVYLDFTSRCFVGSIAFRKDGSIELLDEDCKIERLDDIPFKIAYLLSRGFDLFDLIPNGEAIDKTTL